MKAAKKKRVKHPGENFGAFLTNSGQWPISVVNDEHSIESARELAAWLRKAIRYLEQKEAKR